MERSNKPTRMEKIKNLFSGRRDKDSGTRATRKDSAPYWQLPQTDYVPRSIRTEPYNDDPHRFDEAWDATVASYRAEAAMSPKEKETRNAEIRDGVKKFEEIWERSKNRTKEK